MARHNEQPISSMPRSYSSHSNDNGRGLQDIVRGMCEQFEDEMTELLSSFDRKSTGYISELRSSRKTMRNLMEEAHREREMCRNVHERETQHMQENQIANADILTNILKMLESREKNENADGAEGLQELQPNPFLPEHECVACLDDYNEAVMFSCQHEDEDNDKHYVCSKCCQGYVESKVADGGLAEGGIGLPCAEAGCDGVLLWGSIRKVIDRAIIRPVENRLAAAALSGIEGIEYCKSCHYGTIIDRNEMLFFACQNPDCMAKFCRTCHVDYDKHVNKTCDIADPMRKDKKKALEEFLSRSKFRECHRCKTRFTKDNDESCNKMTCSCGATQCYICKEEDVTYAHFGKGENQCPLFCDTEEADRRNLEHAIQEAQKNDNWKNLLPALLEMRKK